VAPQAAPRAHHRLPRIPLPAGNRMDRAQAV